MKLLHEIKAALAGEDGNIDYKTRDKLFPQAISEIDASVGRIVDALTKHRLASNTLFLFTSDNGPAVGTPDRCADVREAPSRAACVRPLSHGGPAKFRPAPCVMNW